MQLLTYRTHAGEYRAGVRIDGIIHDAEQFTGRSEAASVVSMLEDWSTIEPLLIELAETRVHELLPPAEVASLAAPVRFPGAVYCAAANYRDHMHAMAVRLNQPDEPDPRELDIHPYHFVVPARTCIAGPDEPIRLPPFA